jgi:hypothetical protein
MQLQIYVVFICNCKYMLFLFAIVNSDSYFNIIKLQYARLKAGRQPKTNRGRAFSNVRGRTMELNFKISELF